MFDGATDSAVPLVPPLTGRTVAIVHPAWHSCGSHQVLISQVRAYRSLGAKVISVAIADAPGATEGSNQDKSYMADNSKRASAPIRLGAASAATLRLERF
jgi:hypothetical protein